MFGEIQPSVYLRGETYPVKEKPRKMKDICYHNLRIDITTGRMLGMVLMKKTTDGTYTTRYVSSSMVYFIFLLAVTSYFFYHTLYELLETMKGERVIGSYTIFIQLFSHPLPLIFVAEAKKMNDYFNKWLKFQLEYRKRTGSILDFPCGNVIFALSTMKIIVFFILLWMLLYQFPTLTISSKALIIYYSVMVTMISSFWCVWTYYLYKTADLVQNLARNVVKNKTLRVNFEDIEVVWLDLYQLTKMMGRTFCFTYCYLILFLFLVVMVSTYESLITLSSPITGEKIAFVFVAVIAMIHSASIPFTAHIAANKIGEDFQKLLIDLKTKEKNPPKKAQEIDALLQVISDNHPLIDLGGFVTLDNGLITSLMSTMVTYLIVLVQFKV